MKASEIKNMSADALREKIAEEKAALAKLKFSHTIAGTENPMTLRGKRRDIARMLTLLNEKNKSK
ncbi:MAG: 50S ribosomal protein L29 [Flavobacteriales bacterium]|nr:50S ribosomal protein L29 [Flavobacteriales bacterium]